ncbi:MAG: glycosyltransferase family 4 protein [Thermoplasmata archaeon]|nr:MAG: glycosyltransferase family 4 protein [Thermoplasmata archaeon]
MRIGMITRTISPFDRGGIQRHVAEISRALSREGVEVHLFLVGKALGMNRVLYPGTPLEDTQLEEGIHIHPITVLPTPKLTLGEYLSYSLNAARRVKGFDLDLIHGQSMYSFGCALKKRFPMVLTIQGPQILEYKTELSSKATLNHKITDAAAVLMESYAARKADMLIADSEEAKRTVVERYGVEGNKIRIIVKEGVNVEQFTQSSCESNTILFVGRLHQRKGLDLFLPVFKEISKEQEAVLKIVGSGEKEKALRQQVARLGIGEHVEFLGYLPDQEMRRQYSKASIFVSPSRYEGFGITLLEALASGLPIVATDTGIAGSVVEEGKNGYLVDHDQMKEVILGLLRDGSHRKEFGSRSRQIAYNYTWESAAKRMVEIYQELV